MRLLLIAALCGISTLAYAQPGLSCKLLSEKDLATATKSAFGRLTVDGPSALTPQQVPGLPSTVQFEQCVSDVRPSGAVPVRIGLLAADRKLAAAEWQRVEKAVEEPGESPAPLRQQAFAQATCWEHSWTTRRQLFEAACSRHSGRWHLTVAFEHEDRSSLPPLARISELLERAVAALPAN